MTIRKAQVLPWQSEKHKNNTVNTYINTKKHFTHSHLLYDYTLYVCVWSTKKLTMPAYCVAANCNNLQTTPGITMHKLPRNQPAVRRKWIKFIQFKRADFLAAPHHAHLCSENFSECDFANPHTAWGLLQSWHDVSVLFQNPAWQAQTDTAVSLWVSRAKYQFRLWSSSWPFCSDSPEWCSRHMVTWFGRHGDAFGMTENVFFCAFITLRPQFHLHHRSLTEIVSKITPNLGLVL